MKLEYFIARHFSAMRHEKGMSRPAVRIAVIGIALGLAVMLVSMAVIVGFKTEVSRQIIGFGSHIQILPQYSTSDNELQHISLGTTTEEKIKQIPNVANIQHIISRTGIIHTLDAFQGVILKGVDSTYNWEFFKQNIVTGNTLESDTAPSSAVISQTIADAMQLDTSDLFNVYFVDKTLRVRRFKVVGIYKTTFADYDKLYIITHLKTMQNLNNWEQNQYSQAELLIHNFNHCNETAAQVFTAISADNSSSKYRVESIKTLTPQIFDWLDMLDMNAIVIIILMIAVSGFCIISGLLILILERSNTIGLFKSIGANDGIIRRIFLAQGSILISKGMLWGNLLGITLIAVQYITHIIPLDPESYYVNYVPVYLPIQTWLIINISIAIISTAILIIPTHIITKISPAEAMRHE